MTKFFYRDICKLCILLLRILRVMYLFVKLLNLCFCYFSQESCNANELINVQWPTRCSTLKGDPCSDFTCNSGYKRNESVTSVMCTESGIWSHNASTLCIGLYSYYNNKIIVRRQQEWEGKFSGTDSIYSQISSKTPRGKKDRTKIRHNQRHDHQRQPGEQSFPIQDVTG